MNTRAHTHTLSHARTARLMAAAQGGAIVCDHTLISQALAEWTKRCAAAPGGSEQPDPASQCCSPSEVLSPGGIASGPSSSCAMSPAAAPTATLPAGAALPVAASACALGSAKGAENAARARSVQFSVAAR